MASNELERIVRSPAKINLHLRVGPVAPSGFHPLLSWMTTIGFADEMRFSAAKDSASPGGDVTMSCDDPRVPSDGKNLIIKAAAALRDYAASRAGHPLDLPAIHIKLSKKIPMGGGLGGGSGNAATAIATLNDLWQLKLGARELNDVAARVGSDVAFFLHGPSSICEGRGERVTPIGRPAPRWALLILPGIEMPTPAVYRTFDQLKLGDERALNEPPTWARWSGLAPEELLPLLVNDLEAPAFALRPDLAEIRSTAERVAGRPVRMSGSGSTLFTLFAERTEAIEAAGRLFQLIAEREIKLLETAIVDVAPAAI